MKPSWIPTPAEVGREVLISVVSAIVVAIVIGNVPALKKWMQEQWQ